MKESFVVIGLGRFGQSVARSLKSLRKTVLAIDSSRELVDEIAPEVDAAMCLDTTDKDALMEIGIEDFSCVIVGIGESSLEASILTTALLNQCGVPFIISRATHELHARVLHAVGAHRVVNPEAEIGVRLSRQLVQPSLIEQFSLGEDVTLAEVQTPQQFVGQSLVKLQIRNVYDISIVAIKRDSHVIPNPKGTEVLQEKDILVLIGRTEAIHQVANLV